MQPSAPGTTRSGVTPYLPTGAPCGAGPRLFCFHHAGGTASAFAALRRALHPRVEVVPVQLAGREGRAAEPAAADMHRLVRELDDELAPHLGGSFAFYGHSMGALVAYDLAGILRRRGAPGPRRLVVGAARAPHLTAAFAAHHDRPDDELVQTMIDIGGLSPDLLRYPDWLRPAVTLTRGDLRLCASRAGTAGTPLDCPIDAFHGDDDPLVSRADMAAWSACTTAAFTLHHFRGDHFFFLRGAQEAYIARLAGLLTGPVPRPGIR